MLEALKGQAGAHSSAVLHYLLRFAMLFQRDPYDSAVRCSPPSARRCATLVYMYRIYAACPESTNMLLILQSLLWALQSLPAM